MIAKETIFREYDIRGVVGNDFDAGLARVLGYVYAKKVINDSAASDPSELQIAVGYDCRLTSEELRKALTEGILAAGVKVINSGMGPTPQLYYSVFSRSLDGGIQVTGSHNPADQNGFKMMIGPKTLSGADIVDLKKGVLARPEFESPPYSDSLVEHFDARQAFIDELIARSKPHVGTAKKVKVVVDGGNGVGGLVGPAVLRALGCEVVEIFIEPDGRFPNHHPDPTVLENIAELRKRVVAEKADAGIAWDGDADRIGVVDEKGGVIFGDMLLVLFGRQLLQEVRHPTIIGDVKCSELMFTSLREAGANTVMARTGHSLIKAKMKELHAELAGEMSGHMFFAHRYFGYDDALHASARFIEIITSTTKSVSELLSDLPKTVSTPELRLDCSEEKKFALVEKARAAFDEYPVNLTDGVRITFPKGWGLVRASNTQSALVMRFEADTDAHLKEYRHLVESRIEELKKSL